MKLHEVSEAVSIVDIARNECMRHRADRVETVHLRIGPQASITREALVSSYEQASEGTLVEGSRLEFQDGLGRELHVVAVDIIKGEQRIQEAFLYAKAG